MILCIHIYTKIETYILMHTNTNEYTQMNINQNKYVRKVQLIHKYKRKKNNKYTRRHTIPTQIKYV